ncbi:MAG: hypothetical protein MRY74_03675 [Neomegalonema sp.]|nr:hypothetical protein [Neomegalonema sp.]
MVGRADIIWFKETFWDEINQAVQGSPFDADMLIAIACQETAYIWSQLRKKGLAKDEIVKLCCGDTLDAPRRRAFPKHKRALLAKPRGQEMFDIARAALLSMAAHVPGYNFAFKNEDKFCRGFGVFQYDLQFFKEDPDYFLEKRYERFDETLKKALEELTSALRKRKLHAQANITDNEFCTVAITYNTGRYRKWRGLKQGHFDGKRYYGEHIFDYLATLRGIAAPGAGANDAIAEPGTAIVGVDNTRLAHGPKFVVDTVSSPLNLREEPKISKPSNANVLAQIPDGTEVQAFDGNEEDGFIRLEVELSGRIFRGYTSAKFLIRQPSSPSLNLETIKSASGPKYEVETVTSPLNLRSEPKISTPPDANVVAQMPDGSIVQAIDGIEQNGFLEVEIKLDGSAYRGFCSIQYLKKLPDDAHQPDITTRPDTTPEPWRVAHFPAAHLPPRRSLTARTAIAGAHSLNEPDMPSRTGDTPEELRAELAQIIEYLDVAKGAHERYQPGRGATFCNIYAHDYCALAGVYFPRVWWTDAALLQIANGKVPAPRYGKTVREMRANDLLRWLADYGPQHGWVRAVSLTELQAKANQGAVGLIIARRKIEGRSGHVAIVAPEIGRHKAKRTRSGEVLRPLQSQAGSRNFKYSPGRSAWWTANRFAESAFWYHP